MWQHWFYALNNLSFLDQSLLGHILMNRANKYSGTVPESGSRVSTLGIDQVFFEDSLTMRRKPSLFGKLASFFIQLSHSDYPLTE